MRQASREQSGAGLAERLRERRAEIEQATFTRVYAVSELPRSSGPEYAEGLRAAVSAGIEYGLAGIERGEQSAPPIPEVLLSQARLAARSDVSLDTVLRRYFAGHTLLDDFLMEEVEREESLEGPALKRLLRSQAAIFDRLVAAVGKAYTEEAGRRPEGQEQRRAERVERLLAGELLDTAGLEYDFEGHHLAAVTSGPGAEQALRELAATLDRNALLVPRGEGTVWAWFGGRRRADPAELERLVFATVSTQVSLAFGEPAEGLGGWRLTHRQAAAALPVALRGPQTFVRYADVALLASMLQDDLLATSLRELYLVPLCEGSDGGVALRETLRAYFGANRNITSTASVLGISRRTVATRLGKIEERIGKSLGADTAQLEIALRLDELDESRAKNVGAT
jgi:hypothetical protein